MLIPELPAPSRPPEHPGWQTSHLGLHSPPSWGQKVNWVQVEIFHLTQTWFYTLVIIYSWPFWQPEKTSFFKKVCFSMTTLNILGLWIRVLQWGSSPWCGSLFHQAAQSISSHSIQRSVAVWTCVCELKVCECLYKALTVNFSFSSSMFWSLFFHPLTTICLFSGASSRA